MTNGELRDGAETKEGKSWLCNDGDGEVSVKFDVEERPCGVNGLVVGSGDGRELGTLVGGD